jgi:hypothetical protein
MDDIGQKTILICGTKKNTGLALCSECAPLTFKDGSPTDYTGKWHGKFEKKKRDGKLKVLNRP